MKFSNPEIADAYDIAVAHNPLVIVRNFRGRLSDIPTVALVAEMVARKSPLVALKDSSIKAPSYSNMSKEELQAAARERNIEFDEKDRRADLIKLLTEDVNTQA
jgi:hypothetical protein